MGKKKPVYFVASDRVEKGNLCAVLNVLLQEAEFHAYKRYRREGEIPDEWLLRVREEIALHFRIPSSGHRQPILTRKILDRGPAMTAVLFLRIDQI